MENSDNVYKTPESNLEKSHQRDGLVRIYETRYRNLLITFWMFILSIVVTIIFGDVIAPIAALVMIVGGIGYNVFLGMCAKSVEGSVITWVGLNILFLPLSFLFTLLMMRSRIKGKIKYQREVLASYE